MKVSRLKEETSQYFKQRIIAENLDVNQVLPCSMDSLEHIEHIFVEGTNVLQSEMYHAQSIPSNSRRIIDKTYLEQIQ